MCRKLPKFRGISLRRKRDAAKRLLRLIATEGPDPFLVSWLRHRVWEDATFRKSTENSQFLHDRDGAIAWLRAHGFIREVERRSHLHLAFELTEQAIRWLDWTGFDWSTRKAA